MLICRDPQLSVFKTEKLRTILWAAYPKQCALLGSFGLMQKIQAGFIEAREHQIYEDINHERYLHILFTWQTDSLSTHPQFPWAKDILCWEDCDEFLKMSLLEARSRAELLKARIDP